MSRRRSGYIWACRHEFWTGNFIWFKKPCRTVQSARIMRVERQMAIVERRAARRRA